MSTSDHCRDSELEDGQKQGRYNRPDSVVFIGHTSNLPSIFCLFQRMKTVKEENEGVEALHWSFLSSPPGPVQIKRSHHSSCIGGDSVRNSLLVFEKNYVAVFGGYGYGLNSQVPSRLNDLLFIHPDTNQIQVVQSVSEEKPCSRVSASLCSLLGGILLFGGRRNPSCAFADLWFFDVNEEKWYSVEYDSSLPYPGARWSGSITSLSETHACLYGGRNTSSIFGDLWTIHLVRSADHITASWFCLYDCKDSIYNANQSPGSRFDVCLLPLCSESKSSCTHDYLLVLGGKSSLIGDCLFSPPPSGVDASTKPFLFKCSKRQWLDVTFDDALNQILNPRVVLSLQPHN